VSFRLRLTVLVSAAVAVAIVGASLVVYYTDRSQLMSQVDSDLSTTLSLPQLNLAYGGPATGLLKRNVVRFGSIPVGSKQIVLPGTQKAVRVSVNKKVGGPGIDVPTTRRFTTEMIAGQRSRVLTLMSGANTIRISSSLVEVDRNLSHLRELLVLISLGGIGVAALLADGGRAAATADRDDGEDHRHRRSERADGSARPGRGQPPLCAARRTARHARVVVADPASARRGRFA
jgi:hypothetical protein